MRSATVFAVILAASFARAVAGQAPGALFESASDPTPPTALDGPVLARLRALGIQPAAVCSDAVFVRRAYLDVIGTVPTAEEAGRFIEDRHPKKRSALIDRLLARHEFAVYWAMKWSDILRVKAEFPINLWPNAAQAYHHWIWSCLQENVPYDRFVREQLTASGSNFRVPPVNFYRALQRKDPEGIAQSVALVFMATRADSWPRDRLAGMAAFFSWVGYKSTLEWKEEVVYFDGLKAARDAAEGKPLTAVFPDGTTARLSPDADPRQAFADWLITPRNPWFARAIVNRVWSWLVGRGIVEEPDDFRPDNPPGNPELLDLLAKELVASGYDLKHVYRLILNSRTYQQSSVARGRGPEAEAHFASYPVRRLEAEVLMDALCQITGTTESYSSRIPEPFTWIPERSRTIALPDGSITSPFLEMFGRPPRDTGLESERNNSPTPAQRLHMLNSSHILGKISKSTKLRNLISPPEGGLKFRDAVTRVYLAILSRPPTEKDYKTLEAYAQGEETQGEKALLDLIWALLNSPEFLYRH
jgi:hypothetical protein